MSCAKPNTYVVVLHDSTDKTKNAFGYRFLGIFTDPAAIGSGNQEFKGDVSSLTKVGDYLRVPCGAVAIHVTALRTDGRTKTINILFNARAQTTTPYDLHTPIVLKRCPTCSEWCESGEVKNHCS